MFKLIVINIIIINLIFLCNSDKIPENILKCYSNKEYPSSNEMPPLNIQILIEILRKIESNEILSRDIRILTSMIYERYVSLSNNNTIIIKFNFMIILI